MNQWRVHNFPLSSGSLRRSLHQAQDAIKSKLTPLRVKPISTQVIATRAKVVQNGGKS
jgi:hypothetical protein